MYRVVEDFSGFLKADAVLGNVRVVLLVVPFKLNVFVYTLEYIQSQ